MKRDYYEVLGVARDADRLEIRKAFRKLARECHPDAKPGDPQAEAKFKEGAEAWEVLSDPERRAAYDRYGIEGLRGRPIADGFQNLAFRDLFTAYFGAHEFGLQLHPFFFYHARLQEYLRRRAANAEGEKVGGK
jgi:molecular chaperone DnaJ